MRHPLKATWESMKQRCSNGNHVAYIHYGGRGIKVCERWLGVDGFSNFVQDVGDKPDGCSLDRKDNDGNYEPGNVRWATRQQQAFNRRVLKQSKFEARGIYYNAKKKRYGVRIGHKYIGVYTTITEAIRARKLAEQEITLCQPQS